MDVDSSDEAAMDTAGLTAADKTKKGRKARRRKRTDKTFIWYHLNTYMRS